MALELLKNEEAEKEMDADLTKRKKNKGLSTDILKDDRFADMFKKPVCYSIVFKLV